MNSFRLTGQIIAIEKVGGEEPVWVIQVDTEGSFPVRLLLLRKPVLGSWVEVTGWIRSGDRYRPDFLQAEIRNVRFLDEEPVVLS